MAGPYPAYNSTVEITGTATGMTDEATSVVTGRIYQIDDADKRVLDPSDTYVVNDDGSPVSAANITLDYLHGKITIGAGHGAIAGAITITGDYLPRLAVATARRFAVRCARSMNDVTVFHATHDYRKRQAALLEWTGSIGDLDDGSTDLDAGGGTVKIQSLVRDATPKLLSHTVGGAGTIWRGWVIFDSKKLSGDVGSQFEGDISFKVQIQKDGSGNDVAGASWSDE